MQPALISDASKFKKLIADNLPVAVELSRLLIAHNVLISLNRMYDSHLRNTRPSLKESGDGDRLIHYLFTIGVLKEGLNAFHELIRKHHIWLDQQGTLEKDQEFKQLRVRLSELGDKSNPSGFYSQYIKQARDDAAFHWKSSKIKNLLEQLVKTSDLPKLLIAQSTLALDVRFVLADQLLVQLVPRTSLSPESIERDVKKVAEVGGNFLNFVVRLIKGTLM